MIKTKIGKRDGRAIKALRKKIDSNLGIIANLGSSNKDYKDKMFDLASNGNSKLIADSMLSDDDDGFPVELITFESDQDRTLYHLESLKNKFVKEQNYELASDLRDIEKKLIDKAED